MTANRSGALSIEPKLFTSFWTNGNESLTTSRISETHHLGGCASHVVSVIARDVANQNHFGQSTSFALGGIAHRFKVAVIEVLKPCQHCARSLLLCKHEVFNFDNARNSIFGVTKKLHAHSSRVNRHAMHDPTSTGNQAITALFLNTRQAA